jgi:hypothetical protein
MIEPDKIDARPKNWLVLVALTLLGGFLELPVPVVLATLWLVGAQLIGLLLAALYLYWMALLAAAGA